MALCYNFTRVLNILGFDNFVAHMAEKALSPRQFVHNAFLCRILFVQGAFQAYIVSKFAIGKLSTYPAT
jgi:hypothetical protein